MEIEIEEKQQVCFVLLDKDDIVIQKQPYYEEGFIEAPFDVVCGFVRGKDGKFVHPLT